MKGDSISHNVIPALLVVGGLALAVVIGVLIGSGDWATFFVPALAAMGIAAFLLLGEKYWLLIPFSLSFTFPIIPLGTRAVELPELSIVVCAGLFLIRSALKAQKFHLWRQDHLPFLLYAGWAMFIYFHNPIGFTMFGASSGGARFYFKILLALAAFLIIANQKITERDCKWILILIVVGTFLDLAKTVFFYYVYGGSEYFVDPLENYTWQQQLGVGPLIVVLILFSRYRTADILNISKIWRPILLLVCAAVILVSGKRSGTASFVLYPVVASAVRKEFRYLFLWAACAIVIGSILVVGQGTLFNLPLNAQRSLSWMPGRWDSSLAAMEGGKDVFREKLRDLARERIRQNPLIGRGYEINAPEVERLFLTIPNRSDAIILHMALGSQWHNRWLGYAADFGIPALVFGALAYLFVIWRSWWALPRLPGGSLRQTMVMFILISAVTDVVFSRAGGHSAADAFTRWWMFGLLVGIACALKERRRSVSTEPTTAHVTESGRLIGAGAGVSSVAGSAID